MNPDDPTGATGETFDKALADQVCVEGSPEAEEEAQIAEAIRLSTAMMSEAPPPCSPSSGEITEAMRASSDMASMIALEIKREEADLEMALAMSLQLEEERQRMEMEAEAKAAQAAAVPPLAKDAPPPAPQQKEASPAPAAAAVPPAKEAAGSIEGFKPLVAGDPVAALAPKAAAAKVAAPAAQQKLSALDLPALKKPKESKPSGIAAVYGAPTSQSQLHDEVRSKQALLTKKQAGNDAAKASSSDKEMDAELEVKRREAYLREQRDRIKAKKAAAAAEAPGMMAVAGGAPAAAGTAPSAAPPQLDMKTALAQRFKQDMIARKANLDQNK